MTTGLIYQLYSAHPAPDPAALLAALAGEGIGAVEGFGPWLDDPAATRALLDAAGLAMPSAHVALDRLERDPAAALAMARALGLTHVYVPYLAPEARPDSRAGWQALALRVAQAGAPLADAGLTFGWHNHDFELAPLPGGGCALDVLAETAPALTFELDLGWVAATGQDPLGWLARLGPRLSAVHLKDLARAGGGPVWADPGDGVLDWAAVAAALTDRPDVLRIVERDQAPDPLRLARRGQQTLRTAAVVA